MNLKNNIALVLVLVVVVTAGCSGETTGAPKTPSSSATNSSNPPAEKTAATPQTSAPVADNSSLAPEAVDDLSPEAESTSAAAKPEVAEKASKEPESLPIVHLSEQHKATCKVQVGQQMPDLELVDTNGEPKKLSAFLGERVTVVCFWDAENPFSAWQLSDLGPEVVERFAAQGLNVIAINRGQSAADARAAAEKAGVKFPILVDEDGWTTPTKPVAS